MKKHSLKKYIFLLSLLLLFAILYILYRGLDIIDRFNMPMPNDDNGDVFNKFYISIVCARGYEESLNKLLGSVPAHFKKIIIYQKEDEVSHSIDESGTIIVKVKHNIYEYGHWIGLQYLFENNIIPSESKILMLHSTSMFTDDPTDKIKALLNEVAESNIYYVNNNGSNNMAIIDKVGVETGYNVYNKHLTMDKDYAVQLEVDHNLEESPKAWKIKQKYHPSNRDDHGKRIIYSNNVERMVSYFSSLNMEKYWATNKDGVSKN